MSRATTTCPSCSKRFAAPPQTIGRRVRCPQCAQPFLVQPDPADEPTTIDDMAAAAVHATTAPTSTWVPARVLAPQATAWRPLNRTLLWFAGGTAALAAAALAAYLLWPAVAGKSLGVAGGPAVSGPSGSAAAPPAARRFVGDGLEEEPGRPDVSVPGSTYGDMANGFGREWVIRVAIKDSPAGAREPNLATWAANEKVRAVASEMGCTQFLHSSDSELITAPLHDLTRLTSRLGRPWDPKKRPFSDRRGVSYLTRLTLPPEAVSIDTDRRTITIDLTKAVLAPE